MSNRRYTIKINRVFYENYDRDIFPAIERKYFVHDFIKYMHRTDTISFEFHKNILSELEFNMINYVYNKRMEAWTYNTFEILKGTRLKVAVIMGGADHSIQITEYGKQAKTLIEEIQEKHPSSIIGLITSKELEKWIK